MNRAAQQLGRLAKGKAKTLSKAERRRRAERLAVARQKRWPNTQNPAVRDAPLVARTMDELVGGSNQKEQHNGKR